MGPGWRAAAVGAWALLAACVSNVTTEFSLGEAAWFVVVGKVSAQSETAVSGIFPREAAVQLGSDRLSDGHVLGWKTLPAGLTEPLSRSGRVGVDCDPTLPAPDEVIPLSGLAPQAAPPITGPWLERAECPALPEALAVDNPCALDQCSMIISEGTACGFKGKLDPRCGLNAPVSGRIDPGGAGCLRVHAPGCDPDPVRTNVSQCKLEAQSCELSAFLSVAPLQIERHRLVSGGPLAMPPWASRINERGEPVQLGVWIMHLNEAMRGGYASDLIVVGERVLTLEHTAPVDLLSCTSSSAPDLLRTYALDLSLISTTTVPPCATRLIAGRDGRVIVLHRSERPSLSLLGAGPLRRQALVGSPGCAALGQQPVGAAVRDGQIYVLSTRWILGDRAPTILLRVPEDLSSAPVCATLSPTEQALDFYIAANGRGIAADIGINGIISFDLDGSDLRPHRTRTGFGGADLGQSFEVEPEVIAAALPARQASVQLWDFRGRSNPEPLPAAHQAVWGEGPILIGPYGAQKALVALWSPLGDRDLRASLGVLEGPKWRFAPRSVDLGPGLVGAIVAHPDGGSLVLLPWTGEVIRVLP